MKEEAAGEHLRARNAYGKNPDKSSPSGTCWIVGVLRIQQVTDESSQSLKPGPQKTLKGP